MDRCPIVNVDDDAVELVGIITLCEGGGMGGSRVFPSDIINETAFYFNARSIVLSEKGRIEKIREKRKKIE